MERTERRALVGSIHDSPVMLVLAVAGGGNALVTDLLDVPGASRTVLEIRVPYSEAAMAELVGADAMDAGAVSQSTAEALAAACLDRARSLAAPDRSLIGMGVTAALVTDRDRRGADRAHIALLGSDGSRRHRLVELTKGELDRADQDRIVADAALVELAAWCR